MKRMLIGVAELWLLLFARPLIAQELGPHFQKIREGIYVYGIDNLAGRDPTSNCAIIITQEGVVLGRSRAPVPLVGGSHGDADDRHGEPLEGDDPAVVAHDVLHAAFPAGAGAELRGVDALRVAALVRVGMSRPRGRQSRGGRRRRRDSWRGR